MGAWFSSTFSSSDPVSGVGQFRDEHPWDYVARSAKTLILQSDSPPPGYESATPCACNAVVFVSTICSRLASSLIIATFGMVMLRTRSPQPKPELRSFQTPISAGWISQTGLMPS